MHNAGINPQRRAFTLTELLVAIGAVAVLTVGIGRIFASINGLVSTGIAVAELDQVARTIEQRFREDLEALSDMESDETYIAIRMREIGHPDRPIYLSAEDREFDIRAGVSPYDEESRAVYRRLDEIVFIAGGQAGSRSFATAQFDDFWTEAMPASEHARIYWGHGLKPKQSPDWPAPDPENRFPADETAQRTPPRLFEPDGYFGDRAGENDQSTLNPTIPTIFGRNEYASEWTLVRQPTLLLGPDASGDSQRRGGPFPVMAGAVNALPLGAGAAREYAPFIRDIETFARVWPDLNGFAGEFNQPGNSEDDWPDPRMLRHGRVDIIAQSLEGVRRFLEGEPQPAPDGDGAPVDAPAIVGWPFESGIGRLGQDPDTGDWWSELDNETLQQPLWRWPDRASTTTKPLGQARMDYRDTLQDLRSAIAGTIIRPLVEIEPPVLDHIRDSSAFDEEDPENALMDNHAVIAPRCSSFEIAWTDGSVAIEEWDLNADGVPEYYPGDRIWFDISRVDPTEENAWNLSSIERNTIDEIAQFKQQIRWAQGEPPVSVFGNKALNQGQPVLPTVRWDFRDFGLKVVTGLDTGDNIDAVYNPDMTGGLPSWLADDGGGPPDGFEHIVVFPFRDSIKRGVGVSQAPPNVGVGFDESSEPWPKPTFIRVRMTLHDAQNRIEGGKQYEFIFPINLDD